MKIESIAVKIPSLKVTNQKILEMIDEHNPDGNPVTVKTYKRMIKHLLLKAGADVRYIRDKEKGERAATFIQEAMQEALDNSSVNKDEIDLLIYCGVGKGFIEPANAYFYANAMGMNASCFDICDACMSWIRALEVSYQFLQTGKYRKIMVINGEFNAYEHGYPELFKIKDLKQVKYTFPTYTIGEAASATILTPSDNKWSFDYISKPEFSDLCNIPLESHGEFVNGSSRIALHGAHKFVSYGKEMIDHATIYLKELIKDTLGDKSAMNQPDLYFPHAATSTAYLLGGEDIGIDPDRIWTEVFPSFGNLVSASVPAGLNGAIKAGRLNRGDNIILFPASAGMVYAVVRTTF